MTADWKIYLQQVYTGSSDLFEQHERTGSPLGAESFIEKRCSFWAERWKRKNQGQRLLKVMTDLLEFSLVFTELQVTHSKARDEKARNLYLDYLLVLTNS